MSQILVIFPRDFPSSAQGKDDQELIPLVGITLQSPMLGIGAVRKRSVFGRQILPEQFVHFLGFSSPVTLLRTYRAYVILKIILKKATVVEQSILEQCLAVAQEGPDSHKTRHLLSGESTDELFTGLPTQEDLDWMLCELISHNFLPDGWELDEALAEKRIDATVPVQFVIQKTKGDWVHKQTQGTSFGPKRYSHEF